MAASHETEKRSPPRRSPGEGSVYVTKDGRHRASLLVTDPRTGAEVRRYVSGRNRATVVRRLDDLKRATGAGALPTVTKTAEYLAGWLDAERARLRLGTWRQRELHIRLHIVPAMGHVLLAKLTPADVERMTTGMIDTGRSPRTAAHVRVTLRRALGDALRDGLVARNVAAMARPPRVPSRAMEAGRDYLAPERLRVLLAAVAGHPLGPLVTLAATTGLRQGELLGLAWSDVDLAARSLTVRRSMARAWVTREGERVQGWALQEPKTPRSRRTVNLPTAAVDALERHRTAQEAERRAAGTAWQDVVGLVFTDTVGRPLDGSTVGHAFPTMLDAAGLPHIPFQASATPPRPRCWPPACRCAPWRTCWATRRSRSPRTRTRPWCRNCAGMRRTPWIGCCPIRTDGGWSTARCPAHDDQTPSFVEGRSGRLAHRRAAASGSIVDG